MPITDTTGRRSPALSLRNAIGIVLTVAVLDWLSLFLTRHAGHLATMWPAIGVVLAICLLSEPKAIRVVLVAAAIGSIIAKLAYGDTISTAIFLTGMYRRPYRRAM